MEKNLINLTDFCLTTPESVLACNAVSQHFGLSLTPEEAAAVSAARQDSLLDAGRIEFTGGLTEKLIRTFCPSPFLYQENYASTICDLLEIFHTFKNELNDCIGDDDLLLLMYRAFNGPCHGQIPLLQQQDPRQLAGWIQEEPLHLDEDEWEEAAQRKREGEWLNGESY